MNVKNLGNRDVNYWIDNFGKSSLFRLKKEVNFFYITNQKHDLMHVSFDVTIDQQKKQFQHTGLHTVELMNEMFSL